MKKTKLLITSVVATVALLATSFTSCANTSSGTSSSEEQKNQIATYPIEGQGVVAKTNLSINSTYYGKTTEIVIIPQGKLAQINMADDSSWNTYYNRTDNTYKGVFIKDRNVTLSPFAMGAYEVTQELYRAVMNSNPSDFFSTPVEDETQGYRPVENVRWYDAVIFCNELTKKTMSATDCVYTITNIEYYEDSSDIESADVNIDLTKKGYRLPTEAEWEFAARGGDPTSAQWKNAYAGVQTAKNFESFTDNSPDSALDSYAWYFKNSSSKTHQVGLKTANKLGLYDMSGNVYEWCNDWSGNISTGTETNPFGSSYGSLRVVRGSCLVGTAFRCSVSFRDYYAPNVKYNYLGFRLARSL